MSVAAFACLLVSALGVDEGDWPRTRAERTDYRETSTLRDVSAFLDAINGRGGVRSVATIGRSAGDRPILMAVAARPGAETPAKAAAARKVVVYIQANIHGGEVEGKEAALMLLRGLAQNAEAPWLDRLVLVVVPVYNADGNEALGDAATLRPSQDGPDPVGQRPNAAGLDLNRDAMKAEAPETRAVLRHVYSEWDPDVVLDLHTTNGTRHGFHLTYSPPLSPATDLDVQSYPRDRLLPGVRERLAREKGLRLFDYGNVETRDDTRGWYTFGDEGRYVTNYVGLRNRVSVLSEAASFLPFQTRVETTLHFVTALLDALTLDADHVLALSKAADARRPARVPVRAEPVARGRERVPLEVLVPGSKADHRKAPARLKEEELPIFDRFRATRSIALPAAYLIPPDASEAVALLRRHGVAVERLTAGWRGTVGRFTVGEVVKTPTRPQARSHHRLEGRFESVERDVPTGWFLVRTAQARAALIALLLEPESLDGVAAWGILGTAYAPGDAYPILRVEQAVESATEPVP
jgi:hypothetical protein